MNINFFTIMNINLSSEISTVDIIANMEIDWMLNNI